MNIINEIIFNFTVIYYQEECCNMNIYCKVRDNYDAITEVSTTIKIANKLSDNIYSLFDTIKVFIIWCSNESIFNDFWNNFQTHIIKGENFFCFISHIKENIQNNISISFKTILFKGISSKILKKI